MIYVLIYFVIGLIIGVVSGLHSILWDAEIYGEEEVDWSGAFFVAAFGIVLWPIMLGLLMSSVRKRDK